MKRIYLLLIIFMIGCLPQNQIKESEKFTHEIKKIIEQKKVEKLKVKEIENPISANKLFPSAVIKIKNVALEDFLRVVFSECLKLPYVLDRSIEKLNKKIDIEIFRSNKKNNLFSVVVALLDQYEIDVQDVDGVILITKKINTSENQNSNNENKNQTQDYSKNEKKKSVPSDCVYTYKPVFARAVDLQKSMTQILQNDLSKVITSEQSNQIIIRSTEKEKRMIIKLLHELDEKQKQIYVDVTLAEVSLTGDLSIGLDGFLNTNLIGIKAGAVINNGFGLTGSLIVSDWLKLILQMGEKRGLIKIKSNPYLVIADGSSSSIEIGSEYPVLSSEQATGQTSVLSTVSYRKTGIILDLRPIISGNQIHLSASVEMSEGQKNEISNINSPAILSRKIKFDVLMESDQSLIVGGLISSTQNKSDTYFLSSVQTGISDTSNRTEIILIVHVQIMPEKNIENWFDVLAKKYDNQEIKVN